MLRPCIDCGTPTKGTRCRTHERARDRARGSAHERGYGRQHQDARRALKRLLPADCAYGCGRRLDPEGDWVAAHVEDGNPSAGWQASCRSCNELAKRS